MSELCVRMDIPHDLSHAILQIYVNDVIKQQVSYDCKEIKELRSVCQSWNKIIRRILFDKKKVAAVQCKWYLFQGIFNTDNLGAKKLKWTQVEYQNNDVNLPTPR